LHDRVSHLAGAGLPAFQNPPIETRSRAREKRRGEEEHDKRGEPAGPHGHDTSQTWRRGANRGRYRVVVDSGRAAETGVSHRPQRAVGSARDPRSPARAWRGAPAGRDLAGDPSLDDAFSAASQLGICSVPIAADEEDLGCAREEDERKEIWERRLSRLPASLRASVVRRGQTRGPRGPWTVVAWSPFIQWKIRSKYTQLVLRFGPKLC